MGRTTPALRATAKQSFGWRMQLRVNGDQRNLPEGETLRTLILRYNLKPEKVAIELNRRLVRAGGLDTPLKEGDEVEIVTFVGGGA